MAKRRVPARLVESPGRIRSRAWESEWARLPREEVRPRGRPGEGPWGSLDEERSVPMLVFVGGFGLLLLGLFLSFVLLIGVGAVGMLLGALAGVVQVTRRRRRSRLLWSGIGTVRVDVDRRDAADAPPDQPMGSDTTAP